MKHKTKEKELQRIPSLSCLLHGHVASAKLAYPIALYDNVLPDVRKTVLFACIFEGAIVTGTLGKHATIGQRFDCLKTIEKEASAVAKKQSIAILENSPNINLSSCAFVMDKELTPRP